MPIAEVVFQICHSLGCFKEYNNAVKKNTEHGCIHVVYKYVILYINSYIRNYEKINHSAWIWFNIWTIFYGIRKETDV